MRLPCEGSITFTTRWRRRREALSDTSLGNVGMKGRDNRGRRDGGRCRECRLEMTERKERYDRKKEVSRV